MSDRIIIRQLKLDARIGVYDWEQQVDQPIVLDIELVLPDGVVQSAATHDSLQGSHAQLLDYADVAHCLAQHVQKTSFHLIETAAEQLCQLLLQQFPVDKVKLKLAKPAALAQAKSVSIEIKRERD